MPDKLTRAITPEKLLSAFESSVARYHEGNLSEDALEMAREKAYRRIDALLADVESQDLRRNENVRLQGRVAELEGIEIALRDIGNESRKEVDRLSAEIVRRDQRVAELERELKRYVEFAKEVQDEVPKGFPEGFE